MMGVVTHREILQQPDLWPDTVDRVRRWPCRSLPASGPVVLTGAGTSAYAAAAIASAWPMARAIPSTDLLTGCEEEIPEGAALISLARSGDSPESLGVIDRLRRLRPDVRHFAITCNAGGGLALGLGDSALVLDPRTNDRSLVMTSSFSNLTLAGLCLNHPEPLAKSVGCIADRVRASFVAMEEACAEIAASDPIRVVALASRPFAGITEEAGLKILEMTAGRVVAIGETYLGLRHGPMSFLREDTLVLPWLSNDPVRRRYEEDLLAELLEKKLGRIVSIPAPAPDLPDVLRTPFEIVFAQLLGYHLSMRAGFDPDNPSPHGVITRVVQGVRIHG
jgi:tagatose-6-phosphate ketose/aldose isomerase